MQLKQQGMSNQQIISKLEGQGYNNQQIAESLNQMGIKSNIESGSSQQTQLQPSLFDEEMPVPSPPEAEQQQNQQSRYSPQQNIPYQQESVILSQEQGQDVQELIEAVVEERMKDLSDTFTDFEIWRSRINDDVISIKQEVIRVSNRFDIMQKSVLGKVDEYNKSITDVTSEIKALEKVFQNIITPLTSNIKELGVITKNLKDKT